ncbi:hypothetical protein SETIT_3G065100v2 [Setaria italica]|uniref:Mitochondrial import inner membrane translocase subunit n=1 Tax=Setaria italica TaxID=4555 RepID=K3ZB34_SETIT|nr:mitochondrial import inner membrane translocase subunit Tim9 [Setaria italica]RCV15550.1 hypothetical protein SETIT_3G065100v2 [Setaria italica]
MDAAAASAAATAAGDEEQDQARMDAITEKLQTRDAMRLYNWLSQRCFSDCVVTFYRRALGKREEECVRSCVRKYQLFSTSSAARFAYLADPTSSSSAASDD